MMSNDSDDKQTQFLMIMLDANCFKVITALLVVSSVDLLMPLLLLSHAHSFMHVLVSWIFLNNNNNNLIYSMHSVKEISNVRHRYHVQTKVVINVAMNSAI